MKAVLVICDIQDGKFSILDKASKIAESYQAKLHVLDLVYVRDLTDVEEISQSKVDRFKKQCITKREAEIRAALDSKKIDKKLSEIHVIWAKNLVAETLLLCKSLDPVMVLKRASLVKKQALFSSIDWQFIQHCPAPLLISPLKAFKKKSKILVALDLTTKVKSKMALNHSLAVAGKSLADNIGAELHFACCATVSGVLKELDMITPSVELSKMKARAKPLLEEFQRDYGVSGQQVHFKVGSPAKVLNSISQNLKADCIVLGSIGRKSIKARFLGSTAEQMLEYLHTDMLLIRP